MANGQCIQMIEEKGEKSVMLEFLLSLRSNCIIY